MSIGVTGKADEEVESQGRYLQGTYIKEKRTDAETHYKCYYSPNIKVLAFYFV